MKRLLYTLLSLSLLLVAISASAEGLSRKARKVFNIHTIEPGETLYAISRRYKIPVETLVEDNPTLDPTAISVGSELYIRKSKRGDANERESREGLTEYRNELNRIAPEGLIYHIVAPAEDIYTIAEKFGMSVEELREMNEIKAGERLVAGGLLVVRDPKAAAEGLDDEAEEYVDNLLTTTFATLQDNETLEVALLLPLSVRNTLLKPFAEFYQGFMLGVEDLNNEGYNISVNLFNTERSKERIEEIIADSKYQRSQLVVGPIYEELLEPILRDAESRDVPVVSPLVTLTKQDSPNLFQVAPEPSRRYRKMGELFSQRRLVTLISSKNNDTEYEAEMRAMLDTLGLEYEVFDYEYEHPSVVNERIRVSNEALKIANEIFDRNNYDVDSMDFKLIDSLVAMQQTKSDLTPLFENDVEANTFVILAKDETEVDRILSAISSSHSAQISARRGVHSDKVGSLEFDVIANPAWRNFKNIDHTIYFRDHVVNFASYLAGRDSERVRDFDSRYATAYDDFPSLLAYRGYDVAVIFGHGAFGDMKYGMEGKSYTPLQSSYHFERGEWGERRSNTNWLKVRYNPNTTLTIE